MKILRLVLPTLFVLVLLCGSTNAQSVDISQEKVNPKTFMFSGGEVTLNEYIRATIEEKTTCCGNDGIYLEVVFGSDGKVTSSKTLTGKNDCFKKAAKDIVKEITWDATGVAGSKTVYFEIKPVVACSGKPGENVYTPIGPISGVVEVNETAEADPIADAEEEMEEEVEEVKEEVVASTPKRPVSKPVTAETSTPKIENTRPKTITEPVKEKTETVTSYAEKGDEWSKLYEDSGKADDPKPVFNAATKNTSTSTLEMKEYKPVGNRDPDPSHADTWKNMSVSGLPNAAYREGFAGASIFVKGKLREKGYCGYVQAVVEMMVTPAGEVTDYLILKASSDKVREVLPEIIPGITFSSKSIKFNYRVYVEIKTEILCGEEKSEINLDALPSYLKVEEGGS